MIDTPPLLEARNIARRHPDGRQWLLEDVSLRLAAGQRLAVTGPAGSGKTLLLRAIVLLDPLQTGQILFEGRRMARDEIPRFRRSVVYLHQRPALFDQRVEDVLRRPFSLAVHRQRAFDKDRIVRWLGVLGRKASFLAKRTGDLSGGEAQIVALLRALQLDPRVLLLDEPTASLDRQTSRAVEGLLDGWMAESPDARAMVWVTHDREQAQHVAETTLHIEHGRICDVS